MKIIDCVNNMRATAIGSYPENLTEKIFDDLVQTVYEIGKTRVKKKPIELNGANRVIIKNKLKAK